MKINVDSVSQLQLNKVNPPASENKSEEASGVLEQDQVTLSQEGRAKALGDPDWPDPPASQL